MSLWVNVAVTLAVLAASAWGLWAADVKVGECYELYAPEVLASTPWC